MFYWFLNTSLGAVPINNYPNKYQKITTKCSLFTIRFLLIKAVTPDSIYLFTFGKGAY